MSIIRTVIKELAFILRFGVVGGLIGTIIYSPFDSLTSMLIHSIGNYLSTALGLGWVIVGIPTATISGVVFWGLKKRGMAVGYQTLSWWTACLASALAPILVLHMSGASLGTLSTLAGTLWTGLFFFSSVVLTVRVLELSAQRQYKRLALLGVLGLVWFMSPVIHHAYTFYPHCPG